MTDMEKYAASADECDEQAKRCLVPDYKREWGRLARAYRLLAEQVAVGGLSCSARNRSGGGQATLPKCNIVF